jgi:NADH/NAD ratio-sensing transcriptional regulator Rex
MASAGIRAIMNFAPTALHLRAPVLVRNVDLAGELSMLTHWLTTADAESEAQA